MGKGGGVGGSANGLIFLLNNKTFIKKNYFLLLFVNAHNSCYIFDRFR